MIKKFRKFLICRISLFPKFYNFGNYQISIFVKLTNNQISDIVWELSKMNFEKFDNFQNYKNSENFQMGKSSYILSIWIFETNAKNKKNLKKKIEWLFLYFDIRNLEIPKYRSFSMLTRTPIGHLSAILRTQNFWKNRYLRWKSPKSLWVRVTQWADICKQFRFCFKFPKLALYGKISVNQKINPLFPERVNKTAYKEKIVRHKQSLIKKLYTRFP